MTPIIDLPTPEPYLLLPSPLNDGCLYLGKERSATYEPWPNRVCVRLRVKYKAEMKTGWCADVEAAKRVCDAWVLDGVVHAEFMEASG